MDKLEFEYEDIVSRYAIGQWINLLPSKGNYTNVLGYVSCTNISPNELSEQMTIPKWKEECIDNTFLNILKQLHIEEKKYMISTIINKNNITKYLLQLKTSLSEDTYICLMMNSIDNPKSISLIQGSEVIKTFIYEIDCNGKVVLEEDSKKLVRKKRY